MAIGRAIVRQPKVFLFDEPLSNLDAELRVQMRLELARLHKQIGATMIYVTHDQVEAMTLADKIFVLQSGVVQPGRRPLELYDDPDNRFVAGFIGSPSMNFLAGKVVGADRDRRRRSCPTASTARGARLAGRAAGAGRCHPRHASRNTCEIAARRPGLPLAVEWRRTSAASPTCMPARAPASRSCWSAAAAARTEGRRIAAPLPPEQALRLRRSPERAPALTTGNDEETEEEMPWE